VSAADGSDGLPRGRRRSHPPSLRRLAERLIRDEALFGRGEMVLCACSGGPDSTALLHVLAMLRPRVGHAVVAHGVDHGLRGAAAAELELARGVAERVGVPFAITRVEVAPGANLQERAREARLGALAAAARAEGARVIATGHTADDRAETFLIRLLRGAGPRGLAVLPPRAALPVPSLEGAPPVALIRPLLLARREDVLAHLRRHELPCAEDPSNQDPRFVRTRVRRELIPLLEELSPRVVEHLCALAEMLASGRAAEGEGEAPGEGAGEELAALGRAQRLAIERARKLGRPVQVRLRGGAEVALPFPDDGTVPIERKPARRRP